MPFPINDQFDVNVQLPIDGRSVCADDTARLAIPAGVRYIGMSTHVVATGKTYRLIGGTTNGDWQPDGAGIDTSQFITYLYGDDTTDGSIRINTTNGDFTVEKRIAGVWEFMGSFSI
jgi:hypothetical protein